MGFFRKLFGKSNSCETSFEDVPFEEQIKNKERFIQVQNIVFRLNETRAVVTSEKLCSAVQLIIEDRSRIITDCVRLINSTKNPEVFFQRFEMLEQITAEIGKLEPYGVFQKPYPSEQFQHIMEHYIETVNFLIARVFDDALEKAAVLKTDDAKKRKILTAYTELLSYNLPPECVSYTKQVYESTEIHTYTSASEEAFEKQMHWAEQMNTDLVEVTTSYRICGECAKYQGRIYSISGKDKRFPKFPDYLRESKGAHCGLIVYPFHEEYDIARYVEGDIIATSNRPFVDDRTEEQIQFYEDYIKEKRRKENTKIEYEQIVAAMPDIAPKSLSGYARMKNANTENYRKLVEQAKEKGISISEES